MNYRRLIYQISLACFAILFVEGLNQREAKAEWVRSLYAGQHNWATLTLSPGSYVLKATTFLNLGDVDIEIYDTTDQKFVEGKKVGSETISFNVPQGAQGVFKIKYSMPFCVNPAGACAVNIDIFSR